MAAGIQLGKHSFPSRTLIASWRQKRPDKVWRDAVGREYGILHLAAFADTNERGMTWWIHLPSQVLPGTPAHKSRAPEDMMDMPTEGTELTLVNMDDPSRKIDARVIAYYDVDKWMRTATIIIVDRTQA